MCCCIVDSKTTLQSTQSSQSSFLSSDCHCSVNKHLNATFNRSLRNVAQPWRLLTYARTEDAELSQKSGTNVDFPHCFAPPAPPGVVFHVRSAECERVTWKRRAPIGCWLIAIPSCLARRPSRAILSVTWHLRGGKTSLSSQRHLRRKCAPDVSPAQHCATPRSLLPHKQVAVLECGQACVFPQAGSHHCVFRNNCCKMPSL